MKSALMYFYALISYFVAINPQITFNEFAAIQLTQQIYNSYIPLVQNCDYNHPNISQGNIKLSTLNSQDFYGYVQKQNYNVFWVPIKDGLVISSMLSDNIPPTYNGYILYDSKIQSGNRQVILYELDINASQIIFDYTFINYNAQQITLDFIVRSNYLIQLNNQTNLCISQCLESHVNQNKTIYEIEYLGNDQFIFLCFTTLKGFVIRTGSNDEIGNIFDLAAQASQGSEVMGLASNPQNLVASNIQKQLTQPSYWNLQILFQNDQIGYLILCDIQSLGTKVTCLNHTQILDQVILIVDRVWGTKIDGQFSKWTQILWQLQSYHQQIQIPGSISQIFVSETDNVFIQSVSENKTFLNILDSTRRLMASVSYTGVIVYYGPKIFLIFDKISSTFVKLQLVRPMFLIQRNQSLHPDQYTYLKTEIQCNGQPNIILNYTILWTSFDYPSSLVEPYNVSYNLYSEQQIYIFGVKQFFMLVGPAYDIYLNSTESIESQQIDASIFQIQKQFDFVVGIEYFENKMFRTYLATTEQIFMVSLESLETIVLSKLPCGFDNIATTQKLKNDAYLIVSDEDETCLCLKSFTNCQIINQNKKYLQLSQLSQKNKYKTNSLYANDYLNQNQHLHVKIIPKKNLYQLYSQGYLVTILDNNTVLLIRTQNKQILSAYNMSCPFDNSTQGSIYIKEFYDPCVLLYCYQSTQITQLVFRNQRLYFEREVPLYGFKVRNNSDPLLVGYNYAFLEVDEISERVPALENCCVLRLDPCQYTASFIQQIIQAQQLVFVDFVKTFDVAVFGNPINLTQKGMIKIYYGNAWIAMNYTNQSKSISQNQVQVIFQSFYYNFASIFELNVVFNLSNFDLKTNYQPLTDIQLKSSRSNQGNPILFGSYSYNYSKICGPIFYTIFTQNNSYMNDVQIYQEDIITRTKLLGEVGQDFIQTIIPSDYNLPIANSSLNDLIFIISMDKMFVYKIEQDNVSMAKIKIINLQQQQCTYYIYQQISINNITLIGNCQSPNFQRFNPLLSIQYNGVQITSFQSKISFPMQLRQLYSILYPGNQSIMIGIQRGPIKAKTGKLFMCHNQKCQLLFISSKYQFLLDYDVYGPYNDFLVMSLDSKKISVFITPQFDENQIINPNFTIAYGQITGNDVCSLINLFYAYQDLAKILLSCSAFYYQILVDLANKSLNLKRKYARLPQCAIEDKFKADLLRKQGDIQIIFAICDQDQATLQFQQYLTIGSSQPVIYTGYLQLFAPQVGPSCSNESYFSPIRVIPLSTSMDYPVFTPYSYKNQAKYIYSQINGRLFDNQIQLQPKLVITYTPLSEIFQMPNFHVQISNSYNSLSTSFNSVAIQQSSIGMATKIIFGLFCIFNLINILFIICAAISSNKKNQLNKSNLLRDSLSQRATGFGFDAQIQNFQKDVKERLNSFSRSNSQKSNRFSEIQLFYIKKT